MRRYSVGAVVLGIAMLVLCGCTTTRVVRVEVPVPVPCPAPTIPERPEFPDLEAADTPGGRARKKADAFGGVMGWGLDLETRLKGIAATPTPTPAK